MSRAGTVAWPSRSLKEGALIIDSVVIIDNTVNLMVPTIHADSAPLTRGHKKRSRTRQILLDAALQVLAESGEGFSLTEVATRAGVSHGTFYNYFRDRDALMDAIVPYSVEEFAVRTGQEVDTRTWPSALPSSPPARCAQPSTTRTPCEWRCGSRPCSALC